MKKLLIVLVLLIIVALVFLLKPTSPSKDIDEANVSNELANVGESSDQSDNAQVAAVIAKLNSTETIITGYGPGKIHPGTFSDYEISNVSLDESGMIQSARVVVKSESRDFGIDGLNKHLCTDDFLKCEEYPDIVFELSEVKLNPTGNGYTVVGNLTMIGITKSVSFPVNMVMGESGEAVYATDFRLDITPFEIKYPGIDQEVRVEIRSN